MKHDILLFAVLATMTYGCQTWYLNKQSTNKLSKSNGDENVNLKLQDKIPCSEISKRTNITDIIEHTKVEMGQTYSKNEGQWRTKRCTEWQPRRRKRSRERPSRRWQDDIARKEGTTWNRKATDRRQWKALMEGYILQWMDKA